MFRKIKTSNFAKLQIYIEIKFHQDAEKNFLAFYLHEQKKYLYLCNIKMILI